MVEAELARLHGDYELALSKVTLSLVLFESVAVTFFTAILLESGAQMCFECGQRAKGEEYIKQAICVYAKGGASAKVEHIKAWYKKL